MNRGLLTPIILLLGGTVLLLAPSLWATSIDTSAPTTSQVIPDSPRATLEPTTYEGTTICSQWKLDTDLTHAPVNAAGLPALQLPTVSRVDPRTPLLGTPDAVLTGGSCDECIILCFKEWEACVEDCPPLDPECRELCRVERGIAGERANHAELGSPRMSYCGRLAGLDASPISAA